MIVKIVQDGDFIRVTDRVTDDPIKSRFGYSLDLEFGGVVTFDEAASYVIRKTLESGHVIDEIFGDTRFIISQIAYFMS